MEVKLLWKLPIKIIYLVIKDKNVEGFAEYIIHFCLGNKC